MNVYVDESGDLGFSFDKPYRSGGSSRYLSIAFLLIPPELAYITKRIVKDVYNKTRKSSRYELKGSELTSEDKIFFAKKAKEVVIQNPQIKLLSITVKKENVREHIRQDPNILYNYMIGLILPGNIKELKEINLFPDERSIKVESGNCLSDYLQIKMWFELDSSTKIKSKPTQSKNNLNIQFVDFVCSIFHGHFEYNVSEAYNIIAEVIEIRKLFFLPIPTTPNQNIQPYD